MSSNVSTPYLEPHSATLCPPSPSPLAANPTPLAPLDDIPPLALDLLTSEDDRLDALQLVADSVTEQRQQAAFTLAKHPLILGSLSSLLGGVYQYARLCSAVPTAIFLAAALIASYLLAIHFASVGYLRAAAALGRDWLVSEDGDDDMILAVRSKRDRSIVGALVLRLEASATPPPSGKKKSRTASLRGGKGVIRAWTTAAQFRERGIGEELLREAVRATRDRCGRDAEVGFAKEHANSAMVLPEMFNSVFRRGEMRAAKALGEAAGEVDKEKRKR